MTPLESAQAIVEKWYSQENGKAYLVELITAELARRDEAVKALVEALEDFQVFGTRHDPTPTTMLEYTKCCNKVIDYGPPRTGGYTNYIIEMDNYVKIRAAIALEQYRKQNEGGV